MHRCIQATLQTKVHSSQVYPPKKAPSTASSLCASKRSQTQVLKGALIHIMNQA